MIPWWHYIVAIPAVALLVNGVPHYVHGVSGKRFPTPFSGGAGTLDGAMRNVFWGAGNFAVGGLLFRFISPSLTDAPLVAELIVLAIAFSALLGFVMAHPRRKPPERAD